MGAMRFLKFLIPRMPTVLLGYVSGSLIRFEANGGYSVFLSMASPILIFHRPFELEGKMLAVTHLQKKSRFGFLFTWPLCFHLWITWKYQKQNSSDRWLPGTEIMIPYARTPGWRWDAGDSKFIMTKGFFGMHWD